MRKQKVTWWVIDGNLVFWFEQEVGLALEQQACRMDADTTAWVRNWRRYSVCRVCRGCGLDPFTCCDPAQVLREWVAKAHSFLFSAEKVSDSLSIFFFVLDFFVCVVWQIPNRNNMIGKDSLWSWFLRFQPMFCWLPCFWAMVKQTIMVEGYDRTKLFIFLEAEQAETEKGQG